VKYSLTQKQQVVLDYIQRYHLEHRRAPFIREIQLDCQIASYKSAIDRLNAIERKGYIKRAPNKHRGIVLVPRPVEAAPSVEPAPASGDGTAVAASTVEGVT